MNDKQATLTREAWQALERREECAAGRHEPSVDMGSTLANPLGRYHCECGDVTWMPNRKGDWK